MPARRSLAERSDAWAKLDAETMAAVNVLIERPAPAWPAEFFRLYTPISRALEAVLSGKQPAAQALQAAQAALERQPRVPTAPNPARIVVATPVVEVTPDGAPH